MFLLLLVLSTLVTLSFHGQATQARGLVGSGFSFTAVGDYGQTTATTANLKYIAHSGAHFDLGLGDFNYSSKVTPAAWSAYAKNILGASFPFEILDGDHDRSQIKSLAVDLPDHMGNITGTYAKQYAFDYPASSPLARFILVSPGVYSYGKGSSGYNWVSQLIDGARHANIHWVIVGMAIGCLYISSTSNSKACATSSADLLNLLISKKVDLILQAHLHNYEASKQLTLNGTSCKSISTTTYNASCVVNSSSSMSRGAGSVILTTGTGGESLVDIKSTDPKLGYFRTWMGSNVNPTFGVSHITISATQLSVQFVGVSGSFSDSFSIHG